jgi:hypothetical protein
MGVGAGEESLIADPSHIRAAGLAVCTHFNKSPEILGPEEIRSYQVYLTNERKLAPSSIIIAVAALRFLYKITLHRAWNFEEVIPTPKKPQKLPIVLTQEEVLKFLASVRSIEHRTILTTCYAAGRVAPARFATQDTCQPCSLVLAPLHRALGPLCQTPLWRTAAGLKLPGQLHTPRRAEPTPPAFD